MKRLLILLLLLTQLAKAQVQPQNWSFPTNVIDPPKVSSAYPIISDLKSLTGTSNMYVQVLGGTSLNDGNGGFYLWDATSTLTNNDFTIVAVTNVVTGRWIRIINSNYVKFTTLLSGTALQKSYQVTYPTPLLMKPAMVMPVPYSENASISWWVDKNSITSTGFTIIFNSVPVLGTNNIEV